MAQWSSKRSSHNDSQQNRRKGSHLKPITQAVGEIWKEGSCFLKGKYTRASSLLLFLARLELEIWGTSIKLLSLEAGCRPTVCYEIDFHLFWYTMVWARGVSWIHFDEVTLTISPYSKCCWNSWSLKCCLRVNYLFFPDRNQIYVWQDGDILRWFSWKPGGKNSIESSWRGTLKKTE